MFNKGSPAYGPWICHKSCLGLSKYNDRWSPVVDEVDAQNTGNVVTNCLVSYTKPQILSRCPVPSLQYAHSEGKRDVILNTTNIIIYGITDLRLWTYSL
jgi:hypothetical protein